MRELFKHLMIAILSLIMHLVKSAYLFCVCIFAFSEVLIFLGFINNSSLSEYINAGFYSSPIVKTASIIFIIVATMNILARSELELIFGPSAIASNMELLNITVCPANVIFAPYIANYLFAERLTNPFLLEHLAWISAIIIATFTIVSLELSASKENKKFYPRITIVLVLFALIQTLILNA